MVPKRICNRRPKHLKRLINDSQRTQRPHWTTIPEFHPYIWRHWCAISRLIRSKVETKRWDIWDVKEWMGHERIDTTEDYVKFAKNYYRNAPYDWIRAVLKFYKSNTFVEQQKGTSKIIITR